MEPREAAGLPVPPPQALREAWRTLGRERLSLDTALRRGEWWSVVAEVDRRLLKGAMGLSNDEVLAIRDAATLLRARRTRQSDLNGESIKA